MYDFLHCLVDAASVTDASSHAPFVTGARAVAEKPCAVSARRRMRRPRQGILTEDGKRGCCRSER